MVYLACILSLSEAIGAYYLGKETRIQWNMWRADVRREKLDKEKNETVKLDEAFYDLSEENKQKFVERNLAIADAAGRVTLRFTCPITKELIYQLGTIKVNESENEKQFECYEKNELEEYLNGYVDGAEVKRTTSPITQLEIIPNSDGSYLTKNDDLIKEHRNYLLDLKRALDEIGSEEIKKSELCMKM